MWQQESLNNDCLVSAIRKIHKDYDVVVVGSIDELLSRKTLLKLKHCSLPALPASGAIGMPLGLIGRAFSTDWHHRGREQSFSLPSVYPANHGHIRRVTQGHSPETVVPLFLTQCPTALPTWYGKADQHRTQYCAQITAKTVFERSVESFRQAQNLILQQLTFFCGFIFFTQKCGLHCQQKHGKSSLLS